MANISRIVVKVVSDMGAFSSVITTETKKAESLLFRLSKLQLAPKGMRLGKELEMGDSRKAWGELKEKISNTWKALKLAREELRNPFMGPVSPTMDPNQVKGIGFANARRNRGPLFSSRNLYDLFTSPISLATRAGVSLGVAAASKVKSTISTVGRMAGFAAMAYMGLGLYQLQARTIDVAHNIVTYDKFATSINTSSREVFGLIGRLKILGESAEVAYRALHTLEDLQLAISFKDREAIALLKDLGLQDPWWQKDQMTGFTAITKSINEQQDDLTRLSMAYRVFGDDAAKILRLQSVDKLGLGNVAGGLQKGLDPSTVSMYYQMQQQSLQMSSRLEGATARILTVVGPMLLQAMDMFERAFEAMSRQGAEDVFRTLMTSVAYLIDSLASLPNTIRTVGQAMRLGFAEALVGINQLTAAILRVQGMFSRLDNSGASVQYAESTAEAWKKTAEDARKRLTELATQAANKNGNGFSAEFFITKALNNKPIFDLQSRLEGLLRLYTPLLAKAREYTRESTHPFEAFRKGMRELNAMRTFKMIDNDTFGRSFMRMVADAEKNMNAIDIRLPEAATKDSQAAVSAVNRSEVEHRLTNAKTPQERMARLQEIGNGLLDIIKTNTGIMTEQMRINPNLLDIP